MVILKRKINRIIWKAWKTWVYWTKCIKLKGDYIER